MWILAAALLVVGDDVGSSISSDETVVFFPTYGSIDQETGEWVVRVHGWIYEPSLRGRAAVAVLRRMLGLAPDEKHAATFNLRATAFGVDNERGKVISVRVERGRPTALGRSTANGHFHGQLRLKRSAHEPGWLTFRAVMPEDDDRSFTGAAHLIGPQGVSVISDIDDTIKDSQVAELKKLLRNTFLEPFRPVDGMADAYRRWHEQGAAFHYVSASPWQLYAPLSEFRRAERFPPGTFHLKLFRLKDSTALDLVKAQTGYKLRQIEPLLEAFPGRRFVLVGDSGEQDPEIYGALARKFPDQVQAVYIRNVTGGAADAERYAEAFRDVPADRWRVFDKAAELPDRVVESAGPR